MAQRTEPELQELRRTLFDKTADALEAITETVLAENQPEVEDWAWQRDDGYTVAVHVHGIAEVHIILQMPADDVIAMQG